MTAWPDLSNWSLRRLLVFWWILFLLIQQTQRLFLLPEALAREVPPWGILMKTLLTGLQADLITATIGVILAAILAGGFGLLWSTGITWRGRTVERGIVYRRALLCSSGFIGLLILILLTVDMGYYHFNQQHLNFVFFEYVDDLIVQALETGVASSQAAQQTNAEVQDVQKWGLRLVGFYLLQGIVILAWWLWFSRAIGPALQRWTVGAPGKTNAVLVFGLAAGVVGFHPQGPYAIRTVHISHAEYYTLAQNPILYASEALRAMLDSRMKEREPRGVHTMPLEEAVVIAQGLLGQGAVFPDSRYPLVRGGVSSEGVHFDGPKNVILILVEALDRRFLNASVRGIRVTPFLDRLRTDSIYFEHFFTNGVQTARGLFSSYCSYYPRQGTAAMKTRYTHDYLCLPSVLRKGGYRTEMAISEHRDLNRLHLFMSRNGLHQLFDESDFPAEVERIGSGPSLGHTDGALLDLLRTRVHSLQASGSPFFLTTLTLGTHHPFAVPEVHPDVKALKAEPDGYIAALRYFDLELERFFTDLLREGLLKDTVVIILGDHGRHEKVGRTEGEKQIGHFLAPLFIWMDETLRTPKNYRPRTVSIVASQVDLAPTILAVNGLLPRRSPFLGQDLSCVFVQDCLQENFAYLSSVYDDLIGLASPDGILLYSLRTETLYQTDLELRTPFATTGRDAPGVAERYRQLMALYASSNILLEQNRIWSWRNLGASL